MPEQSEPDYAGVFYEHERGDLMVQEEEFRATAREIPSGVALVSAKDGADRMCTATVNSFSTASCDPPLVSLYLKSGSRVLEAIASSERFQIAMLSAQQDSLARMFSEKNRIDDARRWASITTVDYGGLPVPLDATCYFECVLHDEFVAGDHQGILGRVVDCGTVNPGSSLIYLNRTYRSIQT